MSEIEQKFKVGDVVTLKSGGQEMTVSDIVINIRTKTFQGLIDCQWFVGDSLKTSPFNQSMLKLLSE